MPYPAVDLSRVRTYPVQRRENLVALEDFVRPADPPPPLDAPALVEVAARIVAARRNGRPVIFMLGGHVIKSGLAPVIVDLLERGLVTHIASNGAATIHDTEIALLGHTSEDVAKSIEDGSFGMAEETGSLMNRAIRAGARDGIGLGEALGRWLAEEPIAATRDYSLLYNAYRLGVPYTVHVALGTDIIHQHPECDFAATGFATGMDFRIFCAAVCDLDGGVFCNFGSAVLGPEVFLKALSVARNLGNPVREVTTANFDLLPLSGDYRVPSAKDDPEYYYRPKKNIIIRPTSLGGMGYHITGDHRATIPNLAAEISNGFHGLDARTGTRTSAAPEQIGLRERGDAESVKSVQSVAQAATVIARAFRSGGTLYLCGNGGSFADSLHIAGELAKRFMRPRPVPPGHAARLRTLPGGEMLAERLEVGMRAIALGTNPALASAIDNDSPEKGLAFPQELYALARPGDVLLAISTSGGAQNVLHAVTVAKALGLTVVALTGPRASRLSAAVDVLLAAPPDAATTAEIQQHHLAMYHELCDLLEADLTG